MVAMPSGPFEGFNYHERKGDDGSISSYHSRYRSRSNGRGPPVSRSRDIVQDVYDRMGVNYVRGRSSIENLLEQNRPSSGESQGDGQDLPNSMNRVNSRHSEFGTSSTMKPGNLTGDNSSGHQRSGQCGRLANKWPPVTPNGPNGSDDNGSSHSRNSHNSNKNPTFLVAGSKDRNSRMSMPATFSNFGHRNQQPEHRDEEGKEIDVHAPDDERDAISVLSFKSNKSSVKDRIGMYTSNNKPNTGSRATVRHSYSGNICKRSYPPKVNIYDSTSITGEVQKERMDNSAAGCKIDQSSYIGAPRNHHSSNQSVARSVADAYLTSISKPSNPSSSPRAVSKNIAVVEISTNDFHGHDNASVAASSVSGEDFLPTSPSKKTVSKSHLGRTIGVENDFSKDFIEKLIEDRVQLQMNMLTKRFEAEVRRIENRIDQECKARIEALEMKNQALTTLLSQSGHSM